MERPEILSLVKLDLTMSSTAYDTYLLGLIDRAENAIQMEGIALNLDQTADVMVLVQYAAYLWRKRKGEDLAMPRSLRWELNCRHVAQERGESSGS